MAKQEWLESFLELPNGIPSHDTLERLFARLRAGTSAAVFFELGAGGV
ncbi:MAG: transposase family protein [Cyanobacteria bacterium CRU_2_1]|nr:transposase family protein [Cyanobacteria bacterium RU_5_0]NJR59678.1 transposase family protein [Cyanobacteria bacterium CRU_2_1]